MVVKGRLQVIARLAWWKRRGNLTPINVFTNICSSIGLVIVIKEIYKANNSQNLLFFYLNIVLPMNFYRKNFERHCVLQRSY